MRSPFPIRIPSYRQDRGKQLPFKQAVGIRKNLSGNEWSLHHYLYGESKMGIYMGFRFNSQHEEPSEAITQAHSQVQPQEIDAQHLAEHEKQQLNDE